MPDTLLNMRAFLLTADAGSFSGAARKLRVAPSVVTKRVRQLEWTVRGQLLERSTRHVRLTELGERYVPSMRQVVHEFDDLVSGAAQASRKVEGIVQVRASNTQVMLDLLPSIWRFQRSYPRVTLEVNLINRTVNPIEEGVDIVFGIRQGSYDGVVEEPLQLISRVLCASPDYLACRAPPAHPHEITEHDCIGYAAMDPEWTFNGASGPMNVAITPKIATNSNIVIFSAACAGAGLAVLSRAQAEPALHHGRLIEVLPQFPVSDLWLKAYVPQSRIHLARVQAILTAVREGLLPNRAQLPQQIAVRSRTTSSRRSPLRIGKMRSRPSATGK